MDERTRLAIIENKQRKIREKISEIEEKSAGGNYIYRGEPDTYGQNPFNGKVSSSLWRECKKKMREVDFNIKYVQEEILKNALGYGLNPSEDKFELMSHLQHYGGATNLIDFTTDYRIALFFACEGFSYTRPGRVILLQRNGRINKKYQIEKPQQPINRIIAQKSIFVQPPQGYIEQGDISDIVSVSGALKQRNLGGTMLTYLQKYHDISNATIYNDLHGFVKHQGTYQEACKEFYFGESDRSKGDLLENEDPEKQVHYSSAIRHYHVAIQFNPNYVDAYLNRGSLYFFKEKFDKAIADFDRVTALDPQNGRARDLCDAAQRELGNLDKQ